jgi:hypothetical protein
VHEELACANILMNFAGDVKICDLEHCRRAGEVAKLSDSFSRVMMRLMDKEKSSTSTVGLTKLDNWSDKAIDFFSLTTIKPTVKQLLNHKFMGEKNKEELVWLVPLVLKTAYHSTE